MDTETSQAAAGVFVLLLLTGVIFAVVWLSSGMAFQKNDLYAIHIGAPVSGLSVDGMVELNGVNVGRVKSIALNPHQPQVVDVVIAVRHDTPVSQGTRARLTIRGMTGISYLALRDRGNNLQPPLIQKGEKWPVIPFEASLSLQLDAALGRLTHNVDRMTASLQKLLNDNNLRHIAYSLEKIDTLTGRLLESSQTLQVLLRHSADASQQFPALFKNLNQTVSNFSALSAEVRQNPALLLRGRAASKPGPGE